MKHSIKNIIVFVTLCLTTSLHIVAQYYEIPMEAKINRSAFIFEGRVLKSESFWTKDRKNMFTSHIVQVTQLFKGNLQGDEVEIITDGGKLNGAEIEVIHGLQLHEGQEGVFFCNRTDRPSLASVNSGEDLRVFTGPQGFIRYNQEGKHKIGAEIFHKFDNIERDLLLPLQKKTGQCVKFRPSILAQDLANRLKIHAAFDTDDAEFSIIYDFDNAVITGNNQFLEFDISVSSTASYYFGRSELFIDYDINAFGANLAGSGNVTGNKETVILSSDYTLTLSDSTPSKLKLAIDCLSNPNNPYSTNLTPEKLCHLKLNIGNIVPVMGLYFDDSLMQTRSRYFDSGNFWEYPEVIALDSVWGTFAIPVIESVRPTYISAGTFDTLTIYGSNFGITKGKIHFPNANESYFSGIYSKAEDADVIWNDNQIKVQVYSNNTTDFAVAGSGTIKLERGDDGFMLNDTTYIIIPYAVSNAREDATKEAYLDILVDIGGDSTLTFYLDSDINFNSDTAQIIQKCLDEWRCKTGINWEIGSVYSASSYTQDFENTISYDNSGTYMDSGTLMITRVYKSDGVGSTFECYENGIHYRYSPEIDMIINGFDVDWFYDPIGVSSDTSKYDFWTTLLHELGHAHLQRHAYPSYKLMYGYGRKTDIIRNLDGGAEDGSNWIMDSIEIARSNCPTHIVRNKNGCLNSVYPPITYSLDFNVYPNPTENDVTISFLSHHVQPYDIILLYILGRETFMQKGVTDTGSNSVSLSLNSPKGVYLLKLTVGNHVSFRKIVL